MGSDPADNDLHNKEPAGMNHDGTYHERDEGVGGVAARKDHNCAVSAEQISDQIAGYVAEEELRHESHSSAHQNEHKDTHKEEGAGCDKQAVDIQRHHPLGSNG